MQTTAAFIRKNKLRSSADWTDTNPNMDEDTRFPMTHWKVTIKAGRRQMAVPFSQGMAHTGEPELRVVLDCLASDASGFDNARNFEDWAADYGYDTDSRKAERTFRAIEKQSLRLKELLGEAAFRELLYETERE